MPSPYSTQRYKLNTGQVEYYARNKQLHLLQFWLFLRAYDCELNGEQTGHIKGIAKAIKRIAQKMRRSERAVRTMLTEADCAGLCWVFKGDKSTYKDVIRIRSRAKSSMDCWDSDHEIEVKEKGFVTRGPGPIFTNPDSYLECSVTIPEVYCSESRGRSKSRILDLVRQRCTEYGWGRETFSSLVGMERTSSARLDRNESATVGHQFAKIPIQKLMFFLPKSRHEELGRTVVAKMKNEDPQACLKAWGPVKKCVAGRGHKVWLGQREGEWAIYTQLPVRWDTRFQGRLAPDRDVIKAKDIFIENYPICKSARSLKYMNRTVVDKRKMYADDAFNHISETEERTIHDMLRLAQAQMTTKIYTGARLEACPHVSWVRKSRSPKGGNLLEKKKKLFLSSFEI